MLDFELIQTILSLIINKKKLTIIILQWKKWNHSIINTKLPSGVKQELKETSKASNYTHPCMHQAFTQDSQYTREIFADGIKLIRTWLLKEQVFIHNIHISKAQILVLNSSSLKHYSSNFIFIRDKCTNTGKGTLRHIYVVSKKQEEII